MEILSDLQLYFEDLAIKPDYLIDAEISYRGGSITIDASYFLNFKQSYLNNYGTTDCGTSQNYLGGGMLGSVYFGSNFSFKHILKKDYARFEKLQNELKQLHHYLTNHSDDEWEDQTYKQNQAMPSSAY